MNCMLDTSVFLATLVSSSTEPKERKERCAALIESLGSRIRVSAVTVAELRVFLPKRLEAEVERLERSFLVEPFDNGVALASAEIINKARIAGALCPSCFALGSAPACNKCGSVKGKQQKMNDIYIVATAETHPDVDTLYTVDGPMTALNSFVSKCRIQQPPSIHGPLFDAAKKTA